MLVEGIKDGVYHVVDRWLVRHQNEERGLKQFLEKFRKYNEFSP